MRGEPRPSRRRKHLRKHGRKNPARERKIRRAASQANSYFLSPVTRAESWPSALYWMQMFSERRAGSSHTCANVESRRHSGASIAHRALSWPRLPAVSSPLWKEREMSEDLVSGIPRELLRRNRSNPGVIGALISVALVSELMDGLPFEITSENF